MRSLVAAAAVGLLGLLVLPGCGDDGGDGTVTVLAAASLTDAFTALARNFEEEHEGTTVELSFGPSSGLATSVVEGAPAGVFASASPTAMDVVVEAGEVDGSPADFAQNRLALVMPQGNPGDVRSLDDLARDELLVGLCAPEVPCGEVATEVLEDAGVDPAPDTEEADVRALLTKVVAGELDVGLVYETDVAAAGNDVEGIALSPDAPAGTRYPIAVLEGASDPGAAEDFVDLVRSEEGQRVLQEHGFRAP
jgi:molybdate transport system substrate-binding protein